MAIEFWGALGISTLENRVDFEREPRKTLKQQLCQKIRIHAASLMRKDIAVTVVTSNAEFAEFPAVYAA